MNFFDKLEKKATEAYKMTTNKTGKIAKETKLKFKMNELKEQINDLYEEIGRKVYEKHVREEDISIKDELQEECTKIDSLSEEVEEILQETLNLKDKKQCPNCYTKINIEDNFCSNCGEKQKNESVQEEDKTCEEKSNLEKTVAIESDVEIEENFEEDE